MKSKYLGLFVFVLLIFSLTISCKSSPAAPIDEFSDGYTQPSVGDYFTSAPSMALLSNLEAVSKSAEDARKLSLDFNGHLNFPQEWENAESLYDQAQSSRRTGTVEEVQDSIARYDAAIAAFEAMMEKSIARYFQDLDNEINEARNNALAVGAGYLTPDFLLEIDNEAEDAWALYRSGDYYRARDSAILARDMYKALTIIVEAYNLRMEIDERDLFRFDPYNIIAADELASSAMDDFVDRAIESAIIKAMDARAMFAIALDRGKEGFALEWANAASAERDKALEARANIALRVDFDAADSIFNQGLSYFRLRDFDQSAYHYMQSRGMFIIVTDAAWERRRIAEASLREASRRINESEDLAQRAELIIGGGLP